MAKLFVSLGLKKPLIASALVLSSCSGGGSCYSCTNANDSGTNIINFTTSGLSTDGSYSIAQSQSFKVTASLIESGNNTVESQIIEPSTLMVNGITVSAESFAFIPSNCTISSQIGNESCTITIMVESTATAESYILTMKNQTPNGVPLINESIPFTVIPPPHLRIFVTNNLHNGNYKNFGTGYTNGFLGADAFCQQDSNNPESGSTYWKALLWGNNSTINGETYYKLDYLTVIATATDGNLVESATGKGVLQNAVWSSAFVWTGANLYGLNIDTQNCNQWEAAGSLSLGRIGSAARTNQSFQSGFPFNITTGWADRGHTRIRKLLYVKG